MIVISYLSNRLKHHDMKDYILYRKISRIILQLAEELHISPKRALLLFYSSTVGQQLHDPKYGYQIMSDTYIVNDIKSEIREATDYTRIN